jgi:hypothetical protein
MPTQSILANQISLSIQFMESNARSTTAIIDSADNNQLIVADHTIFRAIYQPMLRKKSSGEAGRGTFSDGPKGLPQHYLTRDTNKSKIYSFQPIVKNFALVGILFASRFLAFFDFGGGLLKAGIAFLCFLAFGAPASGPPFICLLL